MRGRKPIPSHLQLLKGAYDKDPQRENKREPVAPPEPPPCPDHLDELAKIEWWHICGVLDELGLLSRADRAALEIYCQTYSQWRQACEQVSRYGAVLVQKNKQGAVEARRNPFDLVRERTATACTRLLAEFGLTPSSRTRLSVEPQQKERVDARQRA